MRTKFTFSGPVPSLIGYFVGMGADDMALSGLQVGELKIAKAVQPLG